VLGRWRERLSGQDGARRIGVDDALGAASVREQGRKPKRYRFSLVRRATRTYRFPPRAMSNRGGKLMANKAKAIPEGDHSLTSYLSIKGAADAIATLHGG